MFSTLLFFVGSWVGDRVMPLLFFVGSWVGAQACKIEEVACGCRSTRPWSPLGNGINGFTVRFETFGFSTCYPLVGCSLVPGEQSPSRVAATGSSPEYVCVALDFANIRDRRAHTNGNKHRNVQPDKNMLSLCQIVEHTEERI